jgi:hypothetical protein
MRFAARWATRATKNPSRRNAPLWSFSPPHFAVAGLCFAKPLYATAKRHIQPERYMPFFPKLPENILTK